MRALLLILLFTVLAGETCKEKKEAKKAMAGTAEVSVPENTDKTPACIQAKIDSIKKEPRYNPPAQVNEYRYNNKRVFLFSSDCCDNLDVLLDENCKYVCSPTGGFTGKGDFQCNDFLEKAKLVKQVWKDERKQ